MRQCLVPKCTPFETQLQYKDRTESIVRTRSLWESTQQSSHDDQDLTSNSQANPLGRFPYRYYSEISND